MIGPSPAFRVAAFVSLPLDPAAFELPATDRTEIRRAAAVQASVGAGDLAPRSVVRGEGL